MPTPIFYFSKFVTCYVTCQNQPCESVQSVLTDPDLSMAEQ